MTESDIQPQGAQRERFIGRDGRIFIEVLEPGVDTMFFDSVVVLSGPNVLGGNAAVVFKGGCAVGGPKFLSVWDYFDASEMVALFRTNATLRKLDHFDAVKLKSVAETGDPAAQFQMGVRMRGDRGASIDWLTRAAKRNFGPAMVALGGALSGSDWPGEVEAHPIGEAAQPYPSDAFTDRGLAYYWLNRATESTEPMVKHMAESELGGLIERTSPAELGKGRRLILEHESISAAAIDEAVTLGQPRTPEVLAAPDKKSLDEIMREIEGKVAGQAHGPVEMSPEEAEAEFERTGHAEEELEKRLAELERSGRVFRVPCGTVARVVWTRSGQEPGGNSLRSAQG